MRTTYCNKYHRLSDGVPLNHKCRILDPGFLKAEEANDVDAMLSFWERSPAVILHNGEASDEVEDDGEPPTFVYYGRIA